MAITDMVSTKKAALAIRSQLFFGSMLYSLALL